MSRKRQYFTKVPQLLIPMPCPSINPKIFLVGPNYFGPVQTIFSTSQNSKYSGEKTFLVQSKSFWSCLLYMIVQGQVITLRDKKIKFKHPFRFRKLKNSVSTHMLFWEFSLKSHKYRISANSCRDNYSFLELWVRQLIKGDNYSREETNFFGFL